MAITKNKLAQEVTSFRESLLNEFNILVANNTMEIIDAYRMG